MRSVALPFDWVRRHTAGAVRHGIPEEELLAKSSINPRYGDSRDTVGPVQHLLLCMNTTLALEDATHGLARVGVGVAYPAIGLRAALGSSNLEGAIIALGQLYGLASNAVRIQLSTEQEHAILSVHMDAADERDAAYLEENYLSWTFMQILHFLGRAPPVPEVTLRDPWHFNLGSRHWAIGGRVVHGEVTSFRFPRALLGLRPRVRAGDNVMWECHQPWLAIVGGGLSATTETNYVNETGFVRFSELVREYGKSANTVRQHLRAAGGVFRDSRRRALVEVASERLCAGHESVEAIAVELGYSDARSFRRFLKIATGLTPQQIRARGAPGQTADEKSALRALQAISARMNP